MGEKGAPSHLHSTQTHFDCTHPPPIVLSNHVWGRLQQSRGKGIVKEGHCTMAPKIPILVWMTNWRKNLCGSNHFPNEMNCNPFGRACSSSRDIPCPIIHGWCMNNARQYSCATKFRASPIMAGPSLFLVPHFFSLFFFCCSEQKRSWPTGRPGEESMDFPNNCKPRRAHYSSIFLSRCSFLHTALNLRATSHWWQPNQ